MARKYIAPKANILTEIRASSSLDAGDAEGKLDTLHG